MRKRHSPSTRPPLHRAPVCAPKGVIFASDNNTTIFKVTERQLIKETLIDAAEAGSCSAKRLPEKRPIIHWRQREARECPRFVRQAKERPSVVTVSLKGRRWGAISPRSGGPGGARRRSQNARRQKESPRRVLASRARRMGELLVSIIRSEHFVLNRLLAHFFFR